MSDDNLGADIAAAMGGGSTASTEPTGTPASTDDTSAATGAATTEPAQATTDALSTEPAPHTAGPIPFDVHKTALDNARQKAVAEWDQQYGWAKQVNQQEFQQVTDLARRASADPIGYLQDFIKELQSHPEHSAQLRSLAAKALAQRAQSAPAPEQEPQPDLPIQLEDGRVVHLYSADQQAKREAFLHAKWMQTVEQRLQPFQQTHEAMQAERAAVQEAHANEQFATSVTTDVKTWPGVTDEAMKAMALEIANDPQLPRTPEYADLKDAANRAYRKVVVPNAQRAATASVLSNHHLKVDANTVSPNQSTTGAPKSYGEMSWKEAFQAEMAARR